MILNTCLSEFNKLSKKLERTPEEDRTLGLLKDYLDQNIGKHNGNDSATLYPLDIPPGDVFFDNKRFVPKRMSEFILNQHNVFTLNGGLFVYEEGVFNNSGENVIRRVCTDLLGELSSKNKIEETLFQIKTETMLKELPNNRWLINLKNGIYNIETQQFELHDPELKMISQIPVSYKEGAECPEFDKFLKEVLREGDIDLVQEFFGYCLYRDMCIHKAFMLIGDGSNGKTILLNLLKTFLGIKNTCSIELQRIEQDRFAAAHLFGKLANIYPEISDKSMFYTGKFKALTGNDQISAQHKFGKEFEFTSFAKFIFSTNKVPEIKDDTGGLHRRWIYINFPYTFVEEDPDTEKDEKLKDINIFDKLNTEEELSGIFNWAVEGLKRLLKNGKFSYSLSTEENKELHIKLSNPVHAFVLDDCKTSPTSFIVKKDLYEAYKVYCVKNNLPVVQDNSFSRKLQAIPDIRVITERKAVEGKRLWCFGGISLKIIQNESNSVHVVQVPLILSKLRKNGKDNKIEKYIDNTDNNTEEENNGEDVF